MLDPGLGIGCCARDSAGGLILAALVYKEGAFLVLMVELLAIAEWLDTKKRTRYKFEFN